MTRPDIADSFDWDVKNQITHTNKSNNNNYNKTRLNFFVLILCITVNNIYSHMSGQFPRHPCLNQYIAADKVSKSCPVTGESRTLLSPVSDVYRSLPPV